MYLHFDKEGNFVAKTSAPGTGHYSVESEAEMGERYRFVDGALVDAYPGLTDDEVIEAIQRAEEARAAAEAAAIPVKPSLLKLSRHAFRSRFTLEEKTAIYTAAEGSVVIRVFLDDIMAAEVIDLLNADVIHGVRMLEAQGVISEGRADEILNEPGEPAE